MAMPILATAALVTGGWLLISNQRSKMLPPRGAPPDAPSETVGQTEAHESESETNPGVVERLTATFAEPVNPPKGNDPSTTGTHTPGATVVGQAHADEANDATPVQYEAKQVYEMAWGVNTNGMSKSQQADAISRYGGAIGAVW